jgi:hypothetical protein
VRPSGMKSFPPLPRVIAVQAPTSEVFSDSLGRSLLIIGILVLVRLAVIRFP